MDQLDFLLCGGDYQQDGLLEGGQGLLVGDNNHPLGGSELAKQETLGGEQRLGENYPCCEYMKEEANSQLLFQLG